MFQMFVRLVLLLSAVLFLTGLAGAAVVKREVEGEGEDEGPAWCVEGNPLFPFNLFPGLAEKCAELA